MDSLIELIVDFVGQILSSLGFRSKKRKNADKKDKPGDSTKVSGQPPKSH
jgi:hypothetical protein